MQSQTSAHSDPNFFIHAWQRQSEKKPQTPKVLTILHGLGEHGGRYAHLVQGLDPCFTRYYALDQKGHGRTSGLRGWVDHFDDLVNDLNRFIEKIRAENPQQPIVLLAHSFGGLVALKAAFEKKIKVDQLIISAPLLGIKVQVPKVKKILGEVLAKTLSKVQLTNELNPSFLSHDPKVVEAYVNDRLVHNKITPRLYTEMTEAMHKVVGYFKTATIDCPTLFLIPLDDKIVDSEVTLQCFKDLKSNHKTLKTYASFYHEILNEVENVKVFEDIKQWLAQS